MLLIDDIPPCECVINTIPHDINRTTTVRIAVAKLELTPSMPIFDKTDVRAANIDDKIANTTHIISTTEKRHENTRAVYLRLADDRTGIAVACVTAADDTCDFVDSTTAVELCYVRACHIAVDVLFD